MRIEFDTDDKLPLNKTKITIITIVARVVYVFIFQMDVCMKHKQKIINFKRFVLNITVWYF